MMAKQYGDPNELARALAAYRAKKLPPVGQWNPPYRGDADMRIGRDGTWYHLGQPIERAAMVKLFSTVLRRDDDRFFLVTPAERLAITVDDAPFVAVEMFATGTGTSQDITFRTHVDDYVTADADHPIRIELDPTSGEPSPYVLVRDRLEALIARAVFYDMVDLAVERPGPTGIELGVWSAGAFFPIGMLPEEI